MCITQYITKMFIYMTILSSPRKRDIYGIYRRTKGVTMFSC